MCRVLRGGGGGGRGGGGMSGRQKGRDEMKGWSQFEGEGCAGGDDGCADSDDGGANGVLRLFY